jgi:hypothetical protein
VGAPQSVLHSEQKYFFRMVAVLSRWEQLEEVKTPAKQRKQKGLGKGDSNLQVRR